MTKHDAVFELYHVLEVAKNGLETAKWRLAGAKDGRDGPIDSHERDVFVYEQRVSALSAIHSKLYRDGWYQSYDELK